MKREYDIEEEPDLLPAKQQCYLHPFVYRRDSPLGFSLTTTRLGKCEVCAAHDARYTCPKCEVKTCSVRCVQIHKKELDCDGIRDRTKYIPLRQMTKMDFLSDYYFLEECTRYVEDRKNDCIKRYTCYNKVLPFRLNSLCKAAAERKTTLRFLLPNFARHKENTTCYSWKQRKIWWRVEWIFVNAGSLRYVDERLPEDKSLCDLLEKYVNVECVEQVPRKRELEYYQSKGIDSLKVLLKSEGIKRCRKRYYALDVYKSLRENLANKTIVEYPCIYVSYEAEPAGFDIIDSDEDVEGETKIHQELLEQQRKALLDKKFKRNESSNTEDEEKNKLEQLSAEAEKRRSQRREKRKEFETLPNNYLFTDEQLLELLSSSSEDEEANKQEFT